MFKDFHTFFISVAYHLKVTSKMRHWTIASLVLKQCLTSEHTVFLDFQDKSDILPSLASPAG